MHREPVDVVPRRDLRVDGFLVRSGFVINVDAFDRETGAITIPVAAPGSSICEHRALIPRDRYPEFRIRWHWTTSTEFGSRAVQLGALALIAPWLIAAGALIESESPVLRRLGQRIHPKRGHR